MQLKYIESSTTDPYRNLAIESALLRHAKRGECIVFLWQNEKTIVVGRNQDPCRECRVKEFLASGGRIARRKSGGGAVFHDLGNLNYSLISHRKEKYEYPDFMCGLLQRLAVDASYNGRNDIMVQGKKVSGNAVYMDGDMVCQHGTILIKSDIRMMDGYLTPDKSKLDRNHIKSAASRVMNLCEAVPGLTVARVRQEIIGAVEAEPPELLCSEPEIQNLEAFYQDEGWIYSGKTKREDWQ